jgi:small-conductance mechanosensitive channel
VKTNRHLVFGATALALSFASTGAWAQDMPGGSDIGKLAQFIRWGGVFLSVFVVIGALVTLRIVGGITNRLSARFGAQRLLVQKLESFGRFGIYVATGALCLSLSVRLDSTALTVIGGALAFAVGFAMRDLVAAFIAGVTIMFDRPFQVGDRVNYAGEYGDIVAIGLRSVRMLTLDHNVVTIPNNKVLTDVTSSGNYGELVMQVPMEFYIGVDQDVSLASELIREACLMSRFCFLDREVPVLAKQVIKEDYVAFQIKSRPYVLDVKYEKQFETDVHITVQALFQQHGILPPAVLHRSTDAPPTRGAVSKPPLGRLSRPVQ